MSTLAEYLRSNVSRALDDLAVDVRATALHSQDEADALAGVDHVRRQLDVVVGRFADRTVARQFDRLSDVPGSRVSQCPPGDLAAPPPLPAHD